jgi:putative DNA methylase
VQKRKLIEVALPLEAINRESAREKSIRHGHPSTLHLWWARRPLAAARATLFAQLVDDPSSDPSLTEDKQRAERERLHGIIERLVVWENARDERLLAEAHAEILKSTGGNPPPILDPFAGGGTIPLEAQRLGLEPHSSDLNPVAVLINKALIEIPPRFHNQIPVFPGKADSEIRQWKGAEGLVADVRAYGQWMRDEAEKRVGNLYPKVTLAGRAQATVIAWIWARTVTCPNPACRIEMPLVRSWWLGRKRGKEAYVSPRVVRDPSHPSGLRVRFEIRHDAAGAPTPSTDGTVGRLGAQCAACNAAVNLDYLRAEGKAHRIGQTLMAIAAEGSRQRIYLEPTDTEEHVTAADVQRPVDAPDGELSTHPQYMAAPRYGMTGTADLFTNRQLVILTTLNALTREVRKRVVADGGSDDYADAIATYLTMAISRTINKSTAICSWDSSPKMEAVRGLFARQAISMAWDFAEANVLGSSSGNFSDDVVWVSRALEFLPNTEASGLVQQADAAARSYDGVLVCTDPPYYDNVPYADLSDVFYVWLRQALRDVYPTLFSTMLVPKSEELVANYLRQGGKDGAQRFFEDGFRAVFERVRHAALPDYPITVFYAFRQSESDAVGSASTGWETLLDGMLHAGWSITATWPNRSEMSNRTRSIGSNALASSIILALRPRPAHASTTDRRGFIAALAAELPDALRKLQQGQIAPVDLPQAAIGPGMAVFSRYSAVLEPDGRKMSVRSALARINEILDEVLNEQEGDFDPTSRFAIAWYRQHGYGVGKFGDADNLARARNTSVDVMDRDGILTSRAGSVQLIKPSDLGWDYKVVADLYTSNWEALHHLIKVLERDGIAHAGDFLHAALSRPDGAVDADLVKELAHLLFRIAEGNGWVRDALSFNNLVTSWPEILDVARAEKKQPTSAQDSFDFEDDE